MAEQSKHEKDKLKLRICLIWLKKVLKMCLKVKNTKLFKSNV